MSPSAKEPSWQMGLRALNKAIKDTIEEHRRLGLPLVIWREGEGVVEVMAEELDEPSARVREEPKPDESQ